jgi:hypothetical protein
MRRDGWLWTMLAGTMLLQQPARAWAPLPCPFRDVPARHWASVSIAQTAALGIFNGYPDETFHGKQGLTRYVFAVALQRAFDDFQRRFDVEPRPDVDCFELRSDTRGAALCNQPSITTHAARGPVLLSLPRPPKTTRRGYQDVQDDHWAFDAVNELSARGAFHGYPNGTFRGNWPVTRYEVAVALQRFLRDIRHYNPEPELWPTGPIAPRLLSGVPRAHWASGAVTELQRSGVWSGYPGGNFMGDRPMSRYEFSMVLYRMVQFLDRHVDLIFAQWRKEREIHRKR